MPIQAVPVEGSSMISATYQRGDVLAIYTHHGEILVYCQVPTWMQGVLHRSPGSVGKRYNQLIRGRGYPYLRLPAPPPVGTNDKEK